jgi:hypothetical protein
VANAASNDFSLADPRANQVLQKLRGELAITTVFRYLGRPVQINFPTANTQTEVLHGLGEVPDGYLVLGADAGVKRVPGKQWSKSLAYLQSDMANSTVIVAFGVFREAPQNVNAT